MAEKEVLFEDNMETQAEDFNNLQDYIGGSIDHLVVDAIDAGNAYTGLTISKAAATQVSIAIGRLYWGGFVYVLEDPVIIDFQTIPGAMPVSQQRQIAIVAWGSTIQTDTQPRNFVVDADTGQAQPESVSMTQVRLCNIGSINGVESPAANFPAVPATNLLIGYVLMSPSGVVSIQQVTTTQLTNLTTLGNTVGGLLGWQALITGQIATLQTSLAALAASLANYVTLDKFSKLSDLVNQIWLLVNRPANYVVDTIDNFFDTSQSAVGTNVDGAYNAYIHEGIRFVPGATSTGVLALATITDPTVQAWDTFILPKPSGMRVRMDCSFPQLDWVAERVQAHNSWNFGPRKLAWARERHRCGVPFYPSPSPVVFAWNGLLDPIYLNLRFDTGDTWPGVPCNTAVRYPDDDWDFPRYDNRRMLYYWHDVVDVYYWSKVKSLLSYSHKHYGQSFLNAQDGWLGGITVFSMQPAYYQPLSLLIFRCDDQGVPDHQQCIAQLDLDGSSIQSCYQSPIHAGDLVSAGSLFLSNVDRSDAGQFAAAGYIVVETTPGDFAVYYPGLPVYAYPVRLTFTPVFLEAGKRYSFHLLSNADHQFAVSLDRACYSVHQGDFWEYDGTYWFRVMTGGPRSVKFMLHYLVWGQWGQQQSPGNQLRYDVELQPLSLAGGIQSVDVLAEHIVPPATNLSYALLVNNNWMPFAASPDNPGPLTTTSTLLRFKIIFTGTTDVMPGVSLVNSQVKLTSPPINSFYHISTNIPRGGATTVGLKIYANVTNYNTTHHSLSCAIHYGATHMTPSSSNNTLMSDGVTTQFTWLFTQTGISAYQVELTGGTDGTGDNFVVNQRLAYGA